MYTTKNPAFLVFLIFIFCYCQNEKKAKHSFKPASLDTINFTINFANRETVKSVNLLYIDEFNDKRTIEATTDNTESQKFYITANHPILLLDWTENQNYYILFPNEKIIITPTDKQPNKLTFESSLPNREKELQFFENLNKEELSTIDKKLLNLERDNIDHGTKLNRFLILQRFKNIKLRDTKKAVDNIKTKYKNRVLFLANYNKNYKISSTFYLLVKQFFKYDFLSDGFAILNNASNRDNDNQVINDSTFKIDDFNCDSCLVLPSYQSALQEYLSYIFVANKLTSPNNQCEFINSNLSGKTKDFALFTIFKKQINSISKIDSTLYLEFKKTAQDRRYVSYLDNSLSFMSNTTSSKSSSQTILVDRFEKKETFLNLLNKLKGKVVLIDFWASWCKPCIQQIPYSIQLHKSLAEKDVVFLYLSLDKNFSQWVNEEKNMSLEENSYIVLQEFQSPLAKQFNLEGIPRYVILDKSGKVVELDAPRPSDPALRQLIDKYLLKP